MRDGRDNKDTEAKMDIKTRVELELTQPLSQRELEEAWSVAFYNTYHKLAPNDGRMDMEKFEAELETAYRAELYKIVS